MTFDPNNHVVFSTAWEITPYGIDMPAEMVEASIRANDKLNMMAGWVVEHIRSQFPLKKIVDKIYTWQTPSEEKNSYIEEYLTQYKDKYSMRRGMTREGDIITGYVLVTFTREQDKDAFNRIKEGIIHE